MPSTVPDDGARPQPAGALPLPGATSPTSPLLPAVPSTGQLGPLAQQISAAEIEVARLGEQLKQLGIERQQIQLEVDSLTAAWQQTVTDLEAAGRAAQAEVKANYKRAAELPPGSLDSDLPDLGSLSRLRDLPVPGREAQASQLRRAREVEQTARMARDGAAARLRDAQLRYTNLQNTFRQRERALLKLRQDNAAQLAAIERQREAEEQRLGAAYTDVVDGMQANPKAQQAVKFALEQLGEPYEWGAEGPSRWDCSGLMWGAYRSVGQSLPRVSRSQYQATKTRTVSPNAMLPGDLLFFSTSKTDADQIHHVAMYIGGGKMVHAPTTGDVVKISTVWWSRFFAATRVLPAVPAPTTTPTSPSPSPTPAPTTPRPPTSPSTSPSVPRPTTSAPRPTTQPTIPKPPTQRPDPTNSPSATPTPSPMPTPPSASGTRPWVSGNTSGMAGAW